MEVNKTKNVKCRKYLGEAEKPAYLAPKLVVHSGAAFIDKLGAAQACSPSPGF